MKQLAAIFCLFTIALNTALAGAGTLIICEHESGDMHQISRAKHAEQAHGKCCHHDGSLSRDDSGEDQSCDSCTDAEVEVEKLDEAMASVDRIVLKAPLATTAWEAGAHLATIPQALSVKALQPSRAPLLVRGAAAFYADTVQFRC